MGASAWDYVVPYSPDLSDILHALRQRVFDEREFSYLAGDGGIPGGIEELWAEQDVQEEGTHSILDIHQVIEPDDEDRYGTLRPLRPAELVHYFGTTKPTRAVFEQAYRELGEHALAEQGQRWSGYSSLWTITSARPPRSPSGAVPGTDSTAGRAAGFSPW